MVMIKVIIFDFDGTIADTLPFAVNTAIELNRELKLVTKDKINIEKFRTMPSDEFYGSLGISNFKLFLYSIKFLKRLNKNIESLETFKGIQEVLKELRESGVILGVVTSNTKSAVKKFIKDDGLEYFNFIKQSPFLFGKARLLKEVVKKYKVKPNEIIYIGDETRDIDAARKANVKSGVVTWGYNAENILEARNPDFVFRKPSDILQLINN